MKKNTFTVIIHFKNDKAEDYGYTKGEVVKIKNVVKTYDKDNLVFVQKENGDSQCFVKDDLKVFSTDT